MPRSFSTPRLKGFRLQGGEGILLRTMISSMTSVPVLTDDLLMTSGCLLDDCSMVLDDLSMTF